MASTEQTNTEVGHEGGHASGVFPPFDPSTFGSQLLWLAIIFGALYVLMSRIGLPRVEGILAARKAAHDSDLAEAARLRAETEDAIAAFEKALAEAHAHAETPDEASAETPDEASVEDPAGEATAETFASPPLPDKHETGQSMPYAPPGGDLLEDIVGIGEVFAGRLRAAGIGSFAELAASSPERIRQIVGRRAPLSGEPISSWITQADDLARGRHPQRLPPKPKHKETTQ